MKTLHIIFLLFLISACKKTDPYASFRRELRLTDFKAKPYFNARGMIVTEVKYKIIFIDSIEHKPFVKCKIVPETIIHSEKSFIARNGFSSKEILLALKHEQCHYDISSLYAMEFKKVTEQKLFKPLHLEKQIDVVLKDLRPKYDSIQQRFDMDATYVNRQIEKWSKKLKRELKKEFGSL